MQKQVEKCFTWLANYLSESIFYDEWGDAFCRNNNIEVFETFYNEIGAVLDFTKITTEMADILQFQKWSNGMWLIPLYIVPLIPEGTELTGVDGSIVEYHPGEIDLAVQFGCIPYGIFINEDTSTKYRKKPVVIDAYQTDKELDIETLEGTMHASIGDWIITGVNGEQYPCKPDIFEKTYEKV